MSVFNGYKDVLVRKDGEAFKVDGLSPLGFEWIERNVSCSYVSIAPEYIGPMISKIVGAGLSVEVR